MLKIFCSLKKKIVTVSAGVLISVFIAEKRRRFVKPGVEGGPLVPINNNNNNNTRRVAYTKNTRTLIFYTDNIITYYSENRAPMICFVTGNGGDGIILYIFTLL